MAFDVFVKIDGIPGESTDDAHKDWIEVKNFEHRIEQPASATASSVGGATAERVNHFPFQFTHLIDKASPKLYDAANTGKHIKEIVFEFCRSGGSKVKYFEVRLSQALISRVESSGSSTADKDGFPMERVSISYGKINWVYTQQKRADGAGGGNVLAGWDLTTNKVA